MPSSPPPPPAIGTLFALNATLPAAWRYLAFALPTTRPPRAVMLVAHGCRNSGRNWFHSAPEFGHPMRSSLPEESCVSTRALAAGYAVVAPSSSADCWSGADLPLVADLLDAWKASQSLPAQLPLLVYGTSSGGYFAGLAARTWPSVVAVSSTVFVPPMQDVEPPLPRGGGYPPLQLIYMRRDTGKAKEAEALLHGSWEQRAEVEGLICAPRLVTPSYFTERAGLTPDHSRAVQASLVAAGFVKSDGNVASHPHRGDWRAAVLGGLPRKERDSLPSRSLQAAMDAVFQELDVAWGFHAATCEHIEATIAFFERHLPAAAAATAPAPAAKRPGQSQHAHASTHAQHEPRAPHSHPPHGTKKASGQA